MDNDSPIFTNNNTQQLNKYTKRILTARILIFILFAVCVFMAHIGFVLEVLEPYHPGESEDAIFLLILFGSMSLIYFASGVISIRKPFAPFIIAAILTILFLILFIDFSLAGFAYVSNAEISACCITTVLTLAFIFFIIRGAIYAKKYKNLMRIHS